MVHNPTRAAIRPRMASSLTGRWQRTPWAAPIDDGAGTIPAVPIRGYVQGDNGVKVSRGLFEKLVDKALDELPPAFARYLENIIIEVEDSPDAAACRSVGIDDPRGLLGLYHGVPLTHQSVEGPARLPDRISLYQQNIERICRTRDELVAQIRTTVLHEIGHYFGLDEEELDELGYG
jgi:predicted Zn-dependent protease with MMP-like domain